MKKIHVNIKWLVTISLLAMCVYLAVWTRLRVKTELILDYDPWWFYRYAKDILENNLKPPKWDLLSFFPPGREFSKNLGWEYTMIFFYKIFSLFKHISFMKVAILAPVIMVGLSAITAFFLGKELTNEWGGFVTSIVATLTPAFIGVSMAGYCDTDAVVVFFSFLNLFTIFLAMKKRKVVYIALASLTSILFIYSWWFGWYVLFFFTLLIPALFVLRFFEYARKEKFKIDVKQVASKVIGELKKPVIPLIIILLIVHAITIPVGFGSLLTFLLIGLGFTSGESVIVNVSVAELQPINIFTRAGFNAVMGRVGFTVGGADLTQKLFETIGMSILFFLPAFIIYKIYKNMEVRKEEVFLLIWEILTFYLILHGVRFSLMFSCAVAATAGYTVGTVVNLLKKKSIIYRSSVLGLVTFFLLMFVSNAIAYSINATGMEVDQNWIEMLDWLKENADKKAIVATWWDPGHIIAGYTGLRVHADGAHCSPKACIPYNHNIRIQDMGKIMSTPMDEEDDAVAILKKYMSLTPEQCEKVKERFGDIVPDEACKPASEMYFISSSDLIGKFTWMNYFGGYRAPISSGADFQKNPGICCAQTPKTEPGQLPCGEFAHQGRGVWVWCPWIFTFEKVMQDQDGNPVYVYDYGGLKISIIQRNETFIPVYNNQYVINHMTFFFQGQEQDIDLSNYPVRAERIDGLVWVQPDFKSLIYFAPAIKDSIFVRTFFYGGKGLEHFKLVFSNPEIKLYKVQFEES